jgi:virulence-associated protein VapD
MSFGVGIGHNRRRAGRMYAIVFDFDTDLLKVNYPGPSWNNAYDNVKRYLTVRGFTWMQGSTYFGDDTVDAVRCVRVVQKLAKKYSWFTPSVRDIRMLRIEENNDLRIALDDDDD